MSFNQQIFSIINGLARKNAILDVVGIFFAQHVAYLMVVAALFFLIRKKNWKEKIYYFSLVSLPIILSRGIITEIIRFFYHSPRPSIALGLEPLLTGETSYSFPSGHMAAYFALALAVFYINKKVGKWFLGLTAVMGLARIFVGVHWPSDILGGIIVASASFFAIKYYLPSSYKNNEAPLQTE